MEAKMEVKRPVRSLMQKSGHKMSMTWTRDQVKELKSD